MVKILIWDIESLPNRGYFFQVYDASIPHPFIEKTHSIISIAYKWYGEEETNVISIADFPATLRKDPYDDSKVVGKFIDIYNSADYVIAHYGDKFDIPMLRARVLLNGLPPLSNVQTIDTYKLVKKHFKLNTNKLDHLGFWLNEGVKHSMNAQDWVDCAKGNVEVIRKMAEYNKEDVRLLERVFDRILPYVQTKLNVNHGKVLDTEACPHCGSVNLHKRGYYNTRLSRKLVLGCKECNHFFNVKINKEA